MSLPGHIILSDVEASLPLAQTLSARRRERCPSKRTLRLHGHASALVGLVLVACAMALALAPHASASAAPGAACAEDDPCWTWPQMGNRKRGVVSLHGTPLVVGSCRYARMYARAKALGMARLLGPALRGDAWARAHGCERSRLASESWFEGWIAGSELGESLA